MTSYVFQLKSLSFYNEAPQEAIRQPENEINSTGKEGEGNTIFWGTVNVCCYINRANDRDSKSL